MFLLYLLFWFWLFTYTTVLVWVSSQISGRRTTFKGNKIHSNELLFSVIIAARNETNNLPQLLRDLQQQTLASHLWEIILVDDHSDDHSEILVEQFRLHLPLHYLKLDDGVSGKKNAIEHGLQLAKGKWVVSTDADCRLNPFWLENLYQLVLTEGCNWISAPVFIEANSGRFLHNFQRIDLIPVMAFTEFFFKLKMPLMSNAANLAYRKSLVLHDKSEPGTEHASGDDVFLMYKAMNEGSNKLIFADNVESVVLTSPVDSWRELLHQRTRWAGKWSSLPNAPVRMLAIYVFFSNLIACFCLLFGIFAMSPLTIVFFGIKMLLEIWLIVSYANKYQQSLPVLSLIMSTILYPFFAVFIGLFATFNPSFYWKNRHYSK